MAGEVETTTRFRAVRCLTLVADAERALADIREELQIFPEVGLHGYGDADEEQPAKAASQVTFGSDVISTRTERSRPSNGGGGSASLASKHNAMQSSLWARDDLPPIKQEQMTGSCSSPQSPRVPSEDWDEAQQVRSHIVDQVVIDESALGLGSTGRQVQRGRLTFVKRLFTNSTEALNAEPSALGYTRHDIICVPVCNECFAFPVIHPENRWRLIWLLGGFFFIVYEAFSIPFFLAFGTDIQRSFPDLFMVITFIINSYFICDIPLAFCTGHMDNVGQVIMRPKEIAKRYFKTWLILDLIAAIPWEWLGTSEAFRESFLAKSARLGKLLRFVRLLRLIRLLKLRVFIEKAETFIESNPMSMFLIGVTRVVATLFAITHWSACIWYLVGCMKNEGEVHLSWVELHVEPYDFEVGHRYLIAFYYALTTMTTVGYGDIHPTTFVEICFGLFLLCTATVVFAALMGVLTDLISNLNSNTHVKAKKKAQLSCYMHWRKVPRKLRIAIRQHLLFLWETNEGYDTYEEEIKHQLAPVLRTELCHHIYGRIICSAPFFSWLKDYSICVKQLASMVSSAFLERGDHLFRKGEYNQQIYMLLKGSIWLSRNQNLFDEANSALGQLDAAAEVHSSENGFSLPRQTIDGATKAREAVARMQILGRNESNGSKRSTGSSVSGSGSSSSRVSGPIKRLSGARAAREPSRRAWQPPQNSGISLFDSEVLKFATRRLRKEDMARNHAATLVQKRWRALCEQKRREADLGNRVYANGSTTDQSGGGSPRRRARGGGLQVTSRSVCAPAYFGESCLWLPLETWEKERPPVYMYNATSQSRSEVVIVTRRAIIDVVEQFSPWLGERFEYFRLAVLEGLQSVLGAIEEDGNGTAGERSSGGTTFALHRMAQGEIAVVDMGLMSGSGNGDAASSKDDNEYDI